MTTVIYKMLREALFNINNIIINEIVLNNTDSIITL